MKATPKLSAPELQANIIPTPVLKHMGRPEDFHGHWLFAGPGAGKTQLARLWVEQIGRPYAWLQLDPQDNDPLRLLEQLRLALQPLVHPGVLLPSFAPQSGISLQRHCEYLWQTLLDNLHSPCIIVLDDAHHILAWAKHPVLDSLLEGLDPRAHLLVLSRTDLEDHYVRSVINQRIKRIGPSRFQWQVPQLKAWIKQRWGVLKLDDTTAADLLTLSQGRAAILALLDINTLLQDPGSLTTQAAKQLELSELMESSLLTRLAPEARESLFWLACLGSFPASWLANLGFSPEVQSCVHLWKKNSSVVHTLDQDKGELRFHPLFGEILRSQIYPAQRGDLGLRDRIMDACLAKGRVLDAIALCRGTQHWEAYWTLLQGVGLDWIEQGQVGSLAQALGDLPPEVVQRLAGAPLSLFLAATNLAANPRLAYEQARQALEESSGVPELRAVWANALALTAQAVIAAGMHLGHMDAVVDGIDLAIEAPWFLELPAPLRLMALQAGLLASMSGQERPPMQTLYRETEKALLSCENIDLQVATVSALARVVLLHGLAEHVEAIKQHILRVEGLVRSPAAKLSLLHAKTMYHITSGSWQEGYNAARALWAASSSDQPAIWTDEILAYGAFCATNMHDLANCKAMLKPMLAKREKHQKPNVLARMHSQMCLGSVAAHEGRWADADRAYLSAQQAADEYQYSLLQVSARCCLALVRLELEQPAQAKDLLTQVQSPRFAKAHPLNQMLQSFLRCFLLIRDGHTDQAISHTRDILANMERRDSYLQSTAMLPHYAEFLSFGLRHNINPKLIHKIIRRGPIYPKTRPHPDWPSYIEVRVLGRFEILINGKDARSKLVSSGRRFELLTALLWLGGANLNYDQCISWIWHYIPDRPRAIRSIKTALRRLNEDLGRDDAILDQDGKISINPELWSYDLMQNPARDRNDPAQSQLINQLRRGFIGPTPIPSGMRHLVPSAGAVDFGPEPFLAHLGYPRADAPQP